MASARVIEEAPKAELVQVGSTVSVREEGSKPEEYEIVGAAEADPKEGRISNESPLGKAVLGHKAGDRVEVDAPAGKFIVQIVKVK